MSEESNNKPLCQICQRPIEEDYIAEVWSSVDFKEHAWHKSCWDKLIKNSDEDDLGYL